MIRREHNLKLSGEAAQWLIELEDSDDAETRSAFLVWLSTSPLHMQEFLLASSAYKTLTRAGAIDVVDVEALIREAAINVVPLRESEKQFPGIEPKLQRPATRSLRLRWLTGAAAAALLAVTIWISAPGSAPLTTAVGEQRTFKLEDGSVICLNARSRVAVHFSPDMRRIQLLRGEALFVVARDVRRPFVVEAGTATVQAVGTQFNVYRRSDATTISVVEGRVKLLQENAALDAGEEATIVHGGRLIKQKLPDIAKAVAWRQRRLVFHADPLPYIVEQFGRYNATRIELEDEGVRSRALTGIFNADEPIALVNFLRQDTNLQVRETGKGFAIRSRQ